MSNESVTVVVHPDRCMASGGCRRVAPTVFGTDTGGWVKLLDPHPTTPLSDLRRAHSVCPMAAIEIQDENGRTLT